MTGAITKAIEALELAAEGANIKGWIKDRDVHLSALSDLRALKEAVPDLKTKREFEIKNADCVGDLSSLTDCIKAAKLLSEAVED